MHPLPQHLVRTLAPAFLLAIVLSTLGAVAPAHADSVALSNAIMLDPYDPVPEIGFRCDYGCGYRYRDCYYGCYRHRRYSCGPRCRHEKRVTRELNYHEAILNVERGRRFDEMADRYDRQSCEYQWRYLGRGWQYCHHGRWYRDGYQDRWHDGRHYHESAYRPRDYDWRRDGDRWQYWHSDRWYDDGHDGRWHDGRNYRH